MKKLISTILMFTLTLFFVCPAYAQHSRQEKIDKLVKKVDINEKIYCVAVATFLASWVVAVLNLGNSGKVTSKYCAKVMIASWSIGWFSVFRGLYLDKKIREEVEQRNIEERKNGE